MVTFEILHKGYTFPCILLSNGKRLVDFYACNGNLFSEEFAEIKSEVRAILGIEV
jgi:hypothetical protein